MRPTMFGMAILAFAPVLAFGCGGGTAAEDADGSATDAAADVPGDAAIDVPSDGGPDEGPDGPVVDVPVDDAGDVRPESDVRPDAFDDAGRDGGGVDGTDGSGGCDPMMCSVQCTIEGSGSGECVGGTCVCGSGGDGGTGEVLPDILPEGLDFTIPDGWDGTLPDGIIPDFAWEGFDFEIPEGFDFEIPEGFDFAFPDGWDVPSFDGGGPEASLDAGGACDSGECWTNCRAAGYDAGLCDPSGGACLCF